ncbi:MAG: GNAT family N-acetyltransferase [Pyrinomonadaceae bacterium]
MGFSIRPATPADSHALARLRYAFRSSCGEPCERADEFIKRCASWMAARLDGKGLWRCWVVEDEAQIVGQVWLQLIEKIPNPSAEPERHAYLTNLYVNETARGRGLGARLLSTALDFCAAQEVHAVILWPTEKSRLLYQRYGFSRPAELFELRVAAAPGSCF